MSDRELYKEIDTAKKYNAYKELPDYIPENLNPRMELREYQKAAFRNFVTYFETESLRSGTDRVLFHMATGSGKTLIMAGLMLYLYSQGYRDFVFFVNLSNIVRKTKDNFLNPQSSKYLFREKIVLGGRSVPVREVASFAERDPEAINICFTTIQALHRGMEDPREDALTFDELEKRPVVLLSDEAHHLSAATKADKKEQEAEKTWEYTVSRLLNAHEDNLLLEFTATCDLRHPALKAAYEPRIVFDYPLSRFREDGYSKEIKTLRSDLPVMDKALQALMLSQYRLKLFEEHLLAIKPVVLFKSLNIADSRAFYRRFLSCLAHLTGAQLEQVAEQGGAEILQKAYAYFRDRGITFDQLAQELQWEFGEARCLSVNDEKAAEEQQLVVNSLEDADNPYRAIFEVRKLDEGWDVLNLFDIVRLYETRQSGGEGTSATTVSEAQLIGRGARYCPFAVEEGQPLFRRKYDRDLDNPLRVCEELYYHCQNERRYITELRRALQESGALPSAAEDRLYRLKPAFRASALYREGWVLVNRRLDRWSQGEAGLPPDIRSGDYAVALQTGRTGVDVVMEDEATGTDEIPQLFPVRMTFAQLASENFNAAYAALRAFPVFRFCTLRRLFPRLTSARQFLTDPAYLGETAFVLTSRHKHPAPDLLRQAAQQVLGRIAPRVERLLQEHSGSMDWKSVPLASVFTDKTVHYTNPHGDGAGISQNDPMVSEDYRMNLALEDWYAYEDHFGTTEEKAFLRRFRDYVEELRQRYDTVYLLRNERQMAFYSYREGGRFEPDFVLILQRQTEGRREQIQVLFEPKGDQLLEEDAWKEDFLLEIGTDTVRQVLEDGTVLRVVGIPFYNRKKRGLEFRKGMERLLHLDEEEERSS